MNARSGGCMGPKRQVEQLSKDKNAKAKKDTNDGL